MHPEILSITLFGIVAAYSPGPNNFVAFYSGFNFGITRTLPHIIGVTFGFPFLLLCVALGLINVFKLYPLIQEILKYLGTLFLIYLAYKISGCIFMQQVNHSQIFEMDGPKLLCPPCLLSQE